jgi:N-methylhydantoinase A
VFGQELSVRRIIVPYTASVNCAFGLVSADIVHEYSVTTTRPVPTPAEEINELYAPMIERARAQLADEGFDDDRISLEWSVDLRYGRQVHEVTTPVHAATPLDETGFQALVDDFETLYERKYGKGSAYRDAGMEMTMFRLAARGRMTRPEIIAEPLGDTDPSPARIGRRGIFVEARGAMEEADIYDFELLAPGNVVAGPTVIHTPITTIVVQDAQTGRMDEYRNIVIEFD